MFQRKVNWPFGKSWFRHSTPRMPLRTRPAPPVAAQIELLEDRALLSVTLGVAGSFAVLGGSAVTNTGMSAISGNLGVSPGVAVSGFAAGQVTNGAIHVNDAIAVQAHSDLATAYDYLAHEAVTTNLTGQNLGGRTLPHGVYFFSSSAQLTATLTLDAQGDPNAEFVFQIGSTLTTATSSSIVMIGGGKPSNVYWQIGSSATLGTGTAFKGNILALTSITVTTGASILGGSAMAINGAVTLDDNAITDTNVHPSLSGLNANGYYVQGTPPLAIAPNLFVTEPGNVNVTSATVSFTSWQPEDRVAFYNSLGLQNTFTQDLNANTATLTITGSATAAGYQTLLRSVTYQDVSGQPNTSATRVATITIHDPQNSASAMENLKVFQYLSGLGPIVNYVHGSPPLSIAPNLVVTPPEGLKIMSATVLFTNFQAEDRVTFYNSLGLQNTFSQDLMAHTATLTITGAATGAGYQKLLRSVTYQDVAGNPDTSTRSAKITVNDGTNTASAMENVTVMNQPPVVQVNDSTVLTYKVNAAPLAIFSMALVSDPDRFNLSKLTVQIKSGYQNDAKGNDKLSFVNQNGITGSFDAVTGTLTFSGSSYVGNYREVLRLVKFNTTGSMVSTAPRTFTVIATDDLGTVSIPAMRNVTVTP